MVSNLFLSQEITSLVFCAPQPVLLSQLNSKTSANTNPTPEAERFDGFLSVSGMGLVLKSFFRKERCDVLICPLG